MNVKSVLLAGVAALAFAGFTPAAQASLVLVGGTPANSFVDIGAEGFGAAPRMLTLQTHPEESGGVTPVNVVNGMAISGTDKSSTPTLSALGWSSGSNVGIGFNSDQTGSTVTGGLTVNALDLTIYNGTTALGTFHLASPFTFTQADLALQQGNGNAIFDYVLTPTEQTQFNALIAPFGANAGGLFAGLSSDLGCSGTVSPTCQPANDGPDTYLGINQHAVPAPLIGHGLLALLAIGSVLFGGWFFERRNQRLA